MNKPQEAMTKFTKTMIQLNSVMSKLEYSNEANS